MTWGAGELHLISSVLPRRAEWQYLVSSQLYEDRKLSPTTSTPLSHPSRQHLHVTEMKLERSVLRYLGVSGSQTHYRVPSYRTLSALGRLTMNATHSGYCHPPWSVLSSDSRHVGCS